MEEFHRRLQVPLRHLARLRRLRADTCV